MAKNFFMRTVLKGAVFDYFKTIIQIHVLKCALIINSCKGFIYAHSLCGTIPFVPRPVMGLSGRCSPHGWAYAVESVDYYFCFRCFSKALEASEGTLI